MLGLIVMRFYSGKPVRINQGAASRERRFLGIKVQLTYSKTIFRNGAILKLEGVLFNENDYLYKTTKKF